MMIKKGLEVIACWLMHGYLFSLYVAEPDLLKEEEVGLGVGFKCGGFPLL